MAKKPKLTDTENISVGSTVDAFTCEALAGIDSGLQKQGFVTCSEKEAHVKLELHAQEIKEVGGGVKIHIINLGAKEEGTNAQKIAVYAKRKDEADEAERKARMAEAQQREKNANAGMMFE